MMKSLGRSRSLRNNNGSPAPQDSPGREREPFSVGPFKQQKGFPLPSPPSRNRSRSNSNGENVPPDNNHSAATAAYVKANSLNADSHSPAQTKSSRKGRNVGGAAPLPGSPALLPRPPSSKPSPIASKPDSAVAPAQDNLTTAKRKLLWDGNSATTEAGAGVDSTGADSGVQVIVRMRPMNQREEQEEATSVVQKISSDAVALSDQHFTYDSVAGESSSQQEIFEMVGLPMVENCLAGFNSSIFAYGQTGSGKTHTMMGVATDPDSDSSSSEQRGLTPRVLEVLFSRMQQEERNQVSKGLRYQCRCSFLEIYNEQITDLLDPTQKNLLIREDIRTGVYVDSLREEFVSNVDDVTRLLLKGLGNRRTGATNMNNESSRSHSVFTCRIESRFKNLAAGGNSVRSSRMNLVDLAGSERQKQTGAAGERLKEAGNINKSLSQLGNVINILAEVAMSGKTRHIPYRDSRLTFLLQESLGGNAKLAMICAISPASSCRSETLSTLRFAQRAKAIQNKAVVNEETANDVGLLREQIRQLKDELLRMKSNGNQAAGAGGYSNGWNARRSYNLLRLSLSHPTTLSGADSEDNDYEMEIEEEEQETDPGSVVPATATKDATTTSRLSVIEEKDWLGDTSMEIDGSGSSVNVSKDALLSTAKSRKRPDPVDVEEPSSVEVDSGQVSEPELKLIDIHASADLLSPSAQPARTPEVLKTPELLIPRALHSPPLSVSPRMRGASKRGLSSSPLAPRPENPPVMDLPAASPVCEEIYHSTQAQFDSPAASPVSEGTSMSQSLQLKNGSVNQQSSLRASMSAARPTEKLAACLQRGLQILDNQQKSSMASLRRSTAGLRFSIQGSELQMPKIIDKADKGVQTSPAQLVTTSTSPLVFITPQIAAEEISGCRLILHLDDDCGPNPVSSPDYASPEDHLQDSKDGDLQLTTCDESPEILAEERSDEVESTNCLVEGLDESSASDVAHLQLSTFVESPANPIEQPEDSELSPRAGSPETVDPKGFFLQLSPSVHLPSLANRLEDSDQLFLDAMSPSHYHTPGSVSSKSFDTSQWQLVALDVANNSTISLQAQPPQQLKFAKAVEALLTGAIRRERAAEEAMGKQAAEIEQLNRLVRQYKHERECNSILHQTREDKIARLESLMDNVISSDEYLNEEWSALLLEYKMLQEKFDNHPEVTQSSVEQQRLVEELNKYQNFFDLGERDVLLEEVTQLRNHVQNLMEHADNSSGRLKRSNLARRSLQTVKFSEASTECPSPSSMALFAIPNGGMLKKRSLDLSLCAAKRDDQYRNEETAEEVGISNQSWEEEKRELELDWEEREKDWMSVLEELREEADDYKRQGEKRKQEFECEKRCTEEMQDALQMAMTGHARLLEQYAELQEKHIGLLAKQRKIKEGTVDVKKMAKRAGVNSVESRWLDAQAVQISALKVEQDEERAKHKEEKEGLQSQLRDTADAVQAAGELLVRLKEAEESVIIAQDAAAVAEQDTGGLRRDMEKIRRRHATEIATLQQRLLESRLQKTAVCPMCVMAERVKFQFTEVDADTAQAMLEAEARAMALKEEQDWMTQQRQQLQEEEARSQYHDHDESVYTGEVNEQEADFTEELHLDEFEEIDHLFVQS